MYYIYLLYDTYTNGFKSEFLDFFSLISILFGIFIIISKNPIVSVLFLIALFSSISSYLIMLGIYFIGISYLLVYVGAVSILFIFILMLINIRISELLSDTNNSIPLAIIITIAFDYPIYQILPSNFEFSFINNLKYSFYDILYKGEYINKLYNFTINKQIIFASGKNWDGTLVDTTHITSIGNIMYTSYSIWLIITSIILLLAMVGAIVITIKQKN